MGALKIFILSFCLINLAMGQNNLIRNVRYEEDYSFLQNDSSDIYSKLKYLQVFEKGYLSLGGEVRYQIQEYKNEDWGDGPKQEYLAFYTRFLIHADLHVSGFRTFLQLNSTFSTGRPGPTRSIDENRLGFHQVFVEFNALEKIQNQTFGIRIGRQEMKYGSERLITVREGPNNRLSFDAGKLFYYTKHIKIDAVYGRPVVIANGVFDDSISDVKSIWTLYGVLDLGESSKLDLYYIGFENKLASFNGYALAKELRHSLGFRWWGAWQKLSVDLEALYQFGDFGDQSINAYTASAYILYTLHEVKAKPRFGLKTEVISGDKLRTDQQLNTFNPMFPRGAYFGLAAIIGPVNLIDLHPSFEFNLSSQIAFSMDYDLFWRYSNTDGIYGPNVILLYTAQSKESKIGNQLGVNLEYSPNGSLSIVPEFTWFHAREYLKEVGSGKDILFAAVTVQYRF